MLSQVGDAHMIFNPTRNFLLGILGLVAVVVASRQSCSAYNSNSNSLIKANIARVSLESSSEYPGWGVDRVLDGNAETSWFSISGDSTVHLRRPWIQVNFDGGVTVQRVTLLGNREPRFPTGFSVLCGRLDVLGTNGKVLCSEIGESTGAVQDIDICLKSPIANVRAIRFTSLRDQGNENSWGDIAIAEVLME